MGKPLIVHTIEQALRCSKIDTVYVSTDDQEIAAIARKAGATVPFLRPAELATDQAGKLDVIRHLVSAVAKKEGNPDIVVDLDPTSPLRTIDDIEACIAALEKPGVDNVITAFPAEKNPYFNMVENNPEGWARLCKKGSFVRRQDAPNVYSMNASIYVWRLDSLPMGLFDGNTYLYVMPRERSIDIDSEIDFDLVELYMHRRGNEFQ